jgi:hypothetical protein
MCGTIWHEYGHVIMDAHESGQVFAHELRQLADQFSPEISAKWAIEKRTLAYFARYASDPGLDQLDQVLQKVLPPEQYQKYHLLVHKVEHKVAVEAKDVVQGADTIAKVGDVIQGNIFDLRDKMKVDDNAIITGVDLTQVKIADIITFAGCTWKITGLLKDDGNDPDHHEYKMQRTH